MIVLNPAKETEEKSKFSDKKIKAVIKTTIECISNNVKYINSIEDFLDVQLALRSLLTNQISPLFKENEEDIKQYFIDGKFNPVTDFRKNKKLLDLFNLRSKLYYKALLELIKDGSLNNLLNETEKDNLIILLENGFFNKIIKASKEIILELIKNNYYKDKKFGSEIYYGYLKNDKITPWTNLIENLDISGLKDSFLKKYLDSFFSLLKKEKTEYKEYVKIEENEVKNWKNEEGNLKFTVPMEHYNHPNFIDLEFTLYLVDPNKTNLEQIIELSEKYFSSSYNMEKISFYVALNLISCGNDILKKVIGKSFPNDKTLSEKYGKIIFIDPNRIKKISKRSIDILKKLGISNLNKEIINQIRIAEVKYHEFGHSLFIDSENKTVLEELKATLFYFLNLYDNKDYLKEDENGIKHLIGFIIAEYIRRINAKNNPSYYQYWLLESYIYNKAVKNKLISLENNTLKINPNYNNLKNFLEELKKSLEQIKEIYETEDKNEREEKIIKFIGDIFEENALHLKFYEERLNGKN